MKVQYPKCTYSQYCKSNPIKNHGVCNLVEVSLSISSLPWLMKYEQNMMGITTVSNPKDDRLFRLMDPDKSPKGIYILQGPGKPFFMHFLDSISSTFKFQNVCRIRRNRVY